jgi:hypothetical protein
MHFSKHLMWIAMAAYIDKDISKHLRQKFLELIQAYIDKDKVDRHGPTPMRCRQLSAHAQLLSQ